jgi:hypothetical protein
MLKGLCHTTEPCGRFLTEAASVTLGKTVKAFECQPEVVVINTGKQGFKW